MISYLKWVIALCYVELSTFLLPFLPRSSALFISSLFGLHRSGSTTDYLFTCPKELDTWNLCWLESYCHWQISLLSIFFFQTSIYILFISILAFSAIWYQPSSDYSALVNVLFSVILHYKSGSQILWQSIHLGKYV